jgi:hypothetical protein
MAGKLTVLVAVCIALQVASQAQSGFDLARLRDVDSLSTGAPGDRITLGVGFLREEAAHPSPETTGLGGGAIDTGYILQQIARALAFPGAKDPAILRDYRDHEPKGLARDCLTIALGATGAQDTIADLLRIASKDSLGAVRCEAIRVLAHIGLVPRKSDSPPRVRPGEVWKPVDADTDAAIEKALLAALADPRKGYRGASRHEDNTYYPNQNEAALGLRLRGYTVRHATVEGIVTGWRILDKRGALVHSANLVTPYKHQYEDGPWD